MSRLDVELPGVGGTLLRGWLLGPATRGPAPGIVLSHGLSAVREMGLEPFAEAFAAAGFVVLAYDHRNLGASDGTPRGEIDPWAQARDLRRALAWLAARPEVDPARLALWGTSYSGGLVLVVAATDRRVRAAIAQVPFAAVSTEDPDPDGSRFAALRDTVLGDAPEPRAPATGPIAVVDDGSGRPALLQQPEAAAWFLRRGAGTRWRNECTLVSGAAVPFDPGVAVAHVAPTPLLLVVASDDRVAPTELTLAAFARAGEPKRLVVLEGDHFVPYEGPGFARAVRAETDFLAEWLA